MPLIVLSGPPGAGKTTVAHALAARRAAAVVIERDNFLGFIRAGRLLPWLPEAGAQNAIAWTAAVGTALTTRTRLRGRVERVVSAGDIALLYTDWEETGTIERSSRALELLRRQPDRSWRLIVGDPHGREAGRETRG